MSWGELAEMYLRAKLSAKRGDIEDLKNFYQKRLAISWGDYGEDFSVDISPSGYAMGESWELEGALGIKGELLSAPYVVSLRKVRLRFLTVDVQMDHFYCVVRSWSATGSSRLLHCQRLQTWEDIEQVQLKFDVFSNLVFIDAGYSTYEVYRFCAMHNWTALMGDGHASFNHRVDGKLVQKFYSTVRTRRYQIKNAVCTTGVILA